MQSAQELIDEGFNFCKSRKLAEAMKIADEVLATDEKFMEAYRLKFKCYQGSGRYGDMINLAAKAYEVDPNYKFALYYEGIALREKRQYQKSLEVLDKVIALYPDWDFPYNGKGRTLDLIGRFNESIACYDKSFELDPSDPTPLNCIANILQHLGRGEEAIDYYSKGLKINPQNLLLLCNRGELLNSLGRREEALKDFKVAYDQIKEGEIDERMSPGNIAFVKEVVRIIDEQEARTNVNQTRESNLNAQISVKTKDTKNMREEGDDNSITVEQLLKEAEYIKEEFTKLQESLSGFIKEN